MSADPRTAAVSAPHHPVTRHDDSGPTSGSDLAIEWRGLQPVPASSRFGRPRELIPFWFALQLFPVAFFIGAVGAEGFVGLSFWQGALAIVIGSALGAAIVAGLSVMGPRTGAAQLPLARAPFGQSVTLVGVLAYGINIVYLALAAVYGAQALRVVIGSIPFTVALLIMFAVEAAISVVGYELVHRYEQLTALFAGLGFLAIGIAVLTNAGKIHVPQTVHGAALSGSFVLMTVIAFSFSFSWTVNASDYCRYLPEDTSASRLFLSVFAGITSGCVVMEVMGLAAANILARNVSQMKALFDLLSGGALGYAVMVAICIGVVANLTATNYSAGLEILSTGLRVSRPLMTGISAVLGFAVTVWLHGGNLLTKAENLILVATYWVGPFVAIVAIHWWRSSAIAHVYATDTPIERLPSGWRALAALVLGFLACLPFSNTTEGATLAAHGGILKTLFGSISTHMNGADLSYPVGILVAGIAYLLLTYRPRPAAATDKAIEVKEA
jgi:nucleobase:cation symporter-1, NCS1 family